MGTYSLPFTHPLTPTPMSSLPVGGWGGLLKKRMESVKIDYYFGDWDWFSEIEVFHLFKSPFLGPKLMSSCINSCGMAVGRGALLDICFRPGTPWLTDRSHPIPIIGWLIPFRDQWFFWGPQNIVFEKCIVWCIQVNLKSPPRMNSAVRFLLFTRVCTDIKDKQKIKASQDTLVGKTQR